MVAPPDHRSSSKEHCWTWQIFLLEDSRKKTTRCITTFQPFATVGIERDDLCEKHYAKANNKAGANTKEAIRQGILEKENESLRVQMAAWDASDQTSLLPFSAFTANSHNRTTLEVASASPLSNCLTPPITARSGSRSTSRGSLHQSEDFENSG